MYYNHLMHIQDRVYKEIHITEPVIQELIQSAPMQRLQKISQDGAAHFLQPQRDVNRLEHSIGVWYLSFLYKRPVEEQIACLLHDVPHTAFSHVIDFVVQDEKHEFHEQFTEKIIKESEIPDILDKHGILLDTVLNVDQFPLLENTLPDISFDRLDYFLRDGISMGYLSPTWAQQFLSALKLKDDSMYFGDTATASVFALLFMNFSRLIWLDPNSHGAFFLIAEAMKKALTKGLITENDFFTDDEVLMKKMRDAHDTQILAFLDRLTPGRLFEYAGKETAEFYGPNKPRFVDPLVEVEGKLERLSIRVPNLGYYFKEFAKNFKYLGVTQNPTHP